MTGPGDIAISANLNELVFDVMSQGNPTQRTLVVTNQEGFSLRLIPEITGTVDAFTIVPPIANVLPGESFKFEITTLARPLKTIEWSVLRFIGANPNQAVYLISRPSETTGLVVAETKIVMGDVALGESVTKVIRIANVGNETVEVETHIHPKGAFRQIHPSTESFKLPGLSEEDFEIAFFPFRKGEILGTLSICDEQRGERAQQQFSIDLIGQGIIATSSISDMGGLMEKGRDHTPSTIDDSNFSSNVAEWYIYPRTLDFTYMNKPAYLSVSNTGDRNLCFSITVPYNLLWVNSDDESMVLSRSFAKLKFLAKESTLPDKPTTLLITINGQSRHITVTVSPKTMQSKYHHHNYSPSTWQSWQHSIEEDTFLNYLARDVCIYPIHLHFRDSLIRHTIIDYLTIENRSEKIQRWRCVPIAPAYVKQPTTSSSAIVYGETIKKVEKDVFTLGSRSGVLAPRSAIRIPVIYAPYVSGTYLQFFQLQTNDQIDRLEISGKASTSSDLMNRRVRIAQPHFRQSVT